MENHPLRKYLAEAKITQADFAKMIGVKQPTISDVMRGRCRFSLEIASEVEKQTGGAVTMRDLAKPKPRPRRRRRA